MDEHEEESGELGLPVGQVMSDTSDRTTALVGLAAAVVAVATFVIVVLAVEDPPVALVVVLAVLALAALTFAWFKVRVWAGWSNPQLFLPSSDPLHLGDSINARIRRTARGRSNVTGIEMTARLRVEERVTWHEQGAGSSRRETMDATNILYEAPVPVTLNPGSGRTIEAELAIDIPLYEAPPTLDLGNNEIVWELVVDIEAPNAPDDDSVFTLVVDPEVAHRLQAGGSGR